MESFQWSDVYLTGLPEVDDQHHHLVNLINQFSTKLAKNEADINDIQQLFNELAQYAVYHFEEEEKMMLKMKIDSRHLDRHRQTHASFLEDVNAIYATITPQNLAKAQSLLQFLTHWLAYHILGIDQELARQINAIESGKSPQQAYEIEQQEKNRATAPLLTALDGLFELVSLRNKELKQLNESLEQRILERTKELSEANEKLEVLSLTDALTQLPNRRHAMRSLSTLWDEAVAQDLNLVCMMIDADKFKQINDNYGHDAGDIVLKTLSNTLKHAVRNDDLVCRLGGDEFFIICPTTDLNGGMHVAKQVHAAVNDLRVSAGEGQWKGSVSIGVAAREHSMSDYNDLIKQADQAVYLAKEDGKNCVRTLSST